MLENQIAKDKLHIAQTENQIKMKKAEIEEIKLMIPKYEAKRLFRSPTTDADSPNQSEREVKLED